MIHFIFYFSSVIAIAATIMVITRKNAVHALLYFVVSLLAVALMFFILGAPFVSALEVIIYAGAIIVLFIFVVMMLNVNNPEIREKPLLSWKTWLIPSIFSFILLIQFLSIFSSETQFTPGLIGPKDVGISLFTTYLLCVELGGMLLMGGIIGAYHLGRERKKTYHRFIKGDSE